jgi:phage shock protein C
MEKRLYRNDFEKVIAGVSSGIADYMEVDVTIIRLLFVLSTVFLVGTGALVYLVMWIVVPVNRNPAAKFSKFNDYFKQHGPTSGFSGPDWKAPADPVEPVQPVDPFASTNPYTTGPNWTKPEDFKGFKKQNDTGRTVGGLFLLVIGLYFLMIEFDIIPYWFKLHKLWPLVFVAIGLSFIMKSKRNDSFQDWKEETLNQEAQERNETDHTKTL